MNGLRLIPLINGVEPSWANLNVGLNGFPETGIVAISYKDEQDIENIYGVGQNPIARGYGNVKPSASITLLRSSVESIRKSSPTGRLQDIAPFDITILFIQPNGTQIIKHVIKDCQFKTDDMDLKQNDLKNETVFELIVSQIKRS